MTNANDEYNVSEDELEGGYEGTPLSTGKKTFKITEAETATDKNGKLYLKITLEVLLSAKKEEVGRLAWDNYLPLYKNAKTGKLDRRTQSFLKAIDFKGGAPVGTPNGPDASTLVGTIIDNQIIHEWQDVEGKEWPVRSSDKDFSQTKKSGVLEGLTFQSRTSWYSLSDEFVGIGDPDAEPDEEDQAPEAESAEPDWGN